MVVALTVGAARGLSPRHIQNMSPDVKLFSSLIIV